MFDINCMGPSLKWLSIIWWNSWLADTPALCMCFSSSSIIIFVQVLDVIRNWEWWGVGWQKGLGGLYLFWLVCVTMCLICLSILINTCGICLFLFNCDLNIITLSFLPRGVYILCMFKYVSCHVFTFVMTHRLHFLQSIFQKKITEKEEGSAQCAEVCGWDWGEEGGVGLLYLLLLEGPGSLLLGQHHLSLGGYLNTLPQSLLQLLNALGLLTQWVLQGGKQDAAEKKK